MTINSSQFLFLNGILERMKRIFTGIAFLLAEPKLSKGQWLFLAQSVRTFGDGILLGSAAAFFLPEVFGLKEPIQFNRFILLVVSGLFLIGLGVIIIKRGEE